MSRLERSSGCSSCFPFATNSFKNRVWRSPRHALISRLHSTRVSLSVSCSFVENACGGLHGFAQILRITLPAQFTMNWELSSRAPTSAKNLSFANRVLSSHKIIADSLVRSFVQCCSCTHHILQYIYVLLSEWSPIGHNFSNLFKMAGTGCPNLIIVLLLPFLVQRPNLVDAISFWTVSMYLRLNMLIAIHTFQTVPMIYWRRHPKKLHSESLTILPPTGNMCSKWLSCFSDAVVCWTSAGSIFL